MRKILTSVGMVVFAGALVVGATGAFFSDTETSTGNVFAAGAIDLKIDNESYALDWNIPNYPDPTIGAFVLNNNTSWSLQNLGEECQTNAPTIPCLFFNFHDLKPGDYGEDTISLHVDNNDAWACMAIDLTATPENDVNEAELEAGDDPAALDDSDEVANGELQNFLSFVFWLDDGDNVFEEDGQQVSEPILFQGLASEFDGSWFAIADSLNPPALTGGEDYHVGKFWCFGKITPDPVAQGDNNPIGDGTGFTCSGADPVDPPPHNIAQTDGIKADVAFYAVQSRHNSEFLCSSLNNGDGGNGNGGEE